MQYRRMSATITKSENRLGARFGHESSAEPTELKNNGPTCPRSAGGSPRVRLNRRGTPAAMSKLCAALLLAILTMGTPCWGVETQYITTSILTVANGGFDNPDDAYSADLNIGFNFVFGGVTYTKCKMSSNGVLFFSGATADYNNTPLSSMLGSTGVYALWDDLYVGT